MIDGFSLNLGRVDEDSRTASTDDVEEREVEDGFVSDMFDRVSDDFIEEIENEFDSFSLSVRQLFRACTEGDEPDQEEICSLLAEEIPSELHHEQVSPDKSLILVPITTGFLMCHIRNVDGSIEYEDQIISGRRIDNDNLISFFHVSAPSDEIEDGISDDAEVTVSYYSDSRSLERLFNVLDLSGVGDRAREVTIEGEYTGQLDMEAAFSFDTDAFEECLGEGAVEFDKEEEQFTIQMDSGQERYDFIAGRYGDKRRESIRLFLKDRWTMQESLQLPRLRHTHITSEMDEFRETADSVLNDEGERVFSKGDSSTRHIIYAAGTEGTASNDLLDDLITQVRTDANTSIYFPAHRHYDDHLIIEGQNSHVRLFNIKEEHLSEGSRDLIENIYERTEQGSLSELYRSLFSLLTLRSTAICLRTDSGSTPTIADTISDLLDGINYEVEGGEIAEPENDIVEFKLGRRVREDKKDEITDEIQSIGDEEGGPEEFDDLLGYIKLIIWGVDDRGEVIGLENVEEYLDEKREGSVDLDAQQKVDADYVEELRAHISDQVEGRAIAKKFAVGEKTILVTGQLLTEGSSDDYGEALASIVS